ncbi:MAG: tetratricopeptide repeat protein [Tepidisphaeraceae bacterium]|jgi:tetratricopeptide (TPR) repeat protein
MRKLGQWSVVLLCLLGACSSTKDPTAQEAAAKRWNDARSSVLSGLAADQYANGNFDKSRSTIDQAIRLSPDNAAAHVLSAKLYIETGQLEAAEKELALARRADPASAEAEYLSGVVYQRWQQPQRALEFYQHACDKSPAELAYVMAKAEMLVAMGRRGEALTMLQAKVAYFEHSGAIRDEVGLLLVQEGRYPEAIEMFRRAGILATDDLTIREHLAMALFYGKRYSESAGILSELLTSGKFEKRPDLLAALGECQLQTGHAGEAVRSFQQASEIGADSMGVWLGLARAELQLDSPRRAELALRRCMAIDDAASQAHLLLGYVQLRQDRLSEAYASFSRASQLDPTDTVSLCMVGLTLDRLGRGSEAAACYRRALKMNPGDEMAGQLLARLDLNQ